MPSRRAPKWIDAARDAARWDAGALAFVVDQMPIGVILVNRSATVIWANSIAWELLEARDGIALCERRLTTRPHAAEAGLSALIARAIGRPGARGPSRPETVWLARPSGAPALVAVVRSVERPAARSTRGCARAVLFLSDPAHGLQTSRDRLQSLFHLTPAEAALVSMLAAGYSLRAAAARLSIRHETARTYLKRAFAKTHTQRQAELVRLALAAATAGAVDA